MARIFGGLWHVSESCMKSNVDTYLAIPPGTLHTSLLTKNDHLWSFSHCAASSSRANSSPIGQPQPARRTSCMACGLLNAAQEQSGLIHRRKSKGTERILRKHSNAGWSPPTALKFSQIHLKFSSEFSTPTKPSGPAFVSASSSSVGFAWSSRVNPETC